MSRQSFNNLSNDSSKFAFCILCNTFTYKLKLYALISIHMNTKQ